MVSTLGSKYTHMDVPLQNPQKSSAFQAARMIPRLMISILHYP